MNPNYLCSFSVFSNNEQRWLKGLICHKTGKCLAVQGINGSFGPIDEIIIQVNHRLIIFLISFSLQASEKDCSGWFVAVTKQERWVQSVLNNAVYYLNEPPDLNLNESDYSLPSKDDKVTSST